MLDQSKSYKFRGGKFVERTPKEQAELERKRATYYGDLGSAKKSRMPKSKEPFIRITMSQADQLMLTNSLKCVLIFFILSYENFRHAGNAFLMPADKLVRFGFNRRTQERALTQLEKIGLISIRRAHRKPPRITVLTASR
jgi:hypothetical protein